MRVRGYTLVELVVVVMVLGLMLIFMAPFLSEALASMRKANFEKQKMNNLLIVAAMDNYTLKSTSDGRLPAPYTGTGYTKTIYNPADATAAGLALAQALRKTQISPSEINDDGTVGAKVRVYQLAASLTKQMPLYTRSGPLVTITFDYGAIYMTDCTKATATCNPTAATGIPGASAVLTTANYTTWTTTAPDGDPAFVSSEPIQEQMLANTVQRLDKVRDTLLGYLRAQQVTAAAGDTTNWYPNEAGVSAAGSLTGANPATNQGCRDGWYDLSSAGVSVLAAIGLARDEFGTTAWGGRIEYCRDYDPTASQAENAPPHNAAIRINATVSGGAAPDAAVPGNNVVLTLGG